eukprot:1175433-Amphidinium_carterae.1
MPISGLKAQHNLTLSTNTCHYAAFTLADMCRASARSAAQGQGSGWSGKGQHMGNLRDRKHGAMPRINPKHYPAFILPHVEWRMDLELRLLSFPRLGREVKWVKAHTNERTAVQHGVSDTDRRGNEQADRAAQQVLAGVDGKQPLGKGFACLPAPFATSWEPLGRFLGKGKRSC